MTYHRVLIKLSGEALGENGRLFKEIMDIMCPGGGYMFGVAASVDQAPRANMEALFRTIEDYGKY